VGGAGPACLPRFVAARPSLGTVMGEAHVARHHGAAHVWRTKGATHGKLGSRSRRSARMTYVPADDRYAQMKYRRSGRSGLKLPAISLGLWHNFGGDRPLESGRAILRRAFDLGVTHFDLANNYGPPYGSAEETFGRILDKDFRPYRDELVISTKAGYDMWPGPYGEWGSRKYLLASLDQSLARMGLDYVDIFYSHRFDPETPLEETMGAVHTAVQQGKALYAGISSYSAEKTREAAAILRELGTPLLIHQPSYSMLNRWIEPELLDALEEVGAGCITFSPLAQGMLTDKYLNGVPEGSRATQNSSLSPDLLTDEALDKIRVLNEIAKRRGQSLAQLALAWTLRDPRVTSTLIGASSVGQLEDSLGALRNLDLSADELAEIDRYATDSDINLWQRSSSE
jgi:L-glyceraldehyde 3-phosphate reductase